MPVITPVASDNQLPKQAAVCVIGGGVAGVSTALELAERGIDVVLLEKGEIAAEQSSRNWGWCRQMGRDPREIPLIEVSLSIWTDECEGRGRDRLHALRHPGYLCENEAQLADKTRWYEAHAKPAGLSTRMIGAMEANALQPGCTRPWKGALYTPDDARAEPFVAVPLMAEALRRKGGKLFTRCAVRGLETKAGRVSAVVTEKGTISCDTVVLAGGAWSRRFCENLGVALPQLTVVNSVMRTEPLDTGLTRTCSGGHFTFRKRMDGGYTVTHNHFSVADIVPDSFRLFRDFLPALMLDRKGLRLRIGKRFMEEARLRRRWALDEVSPFEQVRVLDPEPVQDILDDAEKHLKEYYPVFRPMKIAERWAGLIDAVPDAVPVISKVDGLAGFHLCTGFSGHGFGLGPGAGKLMAEIVTGERPCVDPSPFRYSRFFDGTRPRPTTGL